MIGNRNSCVPYKVQIDMLIKEMVVVVETV